MAAAPRLVDAYLPSSRKKPMEVLCLGMCRTATESLNKALIELGYSPHKMQAFLGKYRINIPLWEEALRAKYEGIGKRWGRAELDVMLGDYDTLLDVPPILLVEELVEAYPEAKVILSLRDEDSWLRSMQETGGAQLTWWTYPYMWQFHERTRMRVGFFWKCMDYLCKKDLSDQGPARQAFRDHNALVRSLVPPEKLLEFRAEQGWKPLCNFLGKEMPDRPYPRINDRASLLRWQRIAYYITLTMAVTKISAMILTPLLIGRYIWSWNRNR